MVARSYKACFAAASAAAGRELSDQELDRVFMQAQRRMNKYEREGMSRRDAAARAGADAVADAALETALERRSAALNVLRRQALDARVTTGSEARTVRQVLTGDQSAGRDAGRSIDAERHALTAQLLGPMIAELRKAKLLKVLTGRDKAFDREMAREMWRLEDPSLPPGTTDRHAAAAAAILHDAQQTARAMQNEVGAWIGKDIHYVTRQNHDMMKVRGAGPQGDFEAWREKIEPKLDPRTFDRLENPADPAAREDLLRHIWSNLSSGVHETSSSATLAGFTGPGNLAKKASAERVLLFRDADAWFDYNEEFGHGAVIDGVFHGLERAARDTALMRTLGTNPEALFQRWVKSMQEAARDRSDFQAVEALKSDWNKRILATVTGEANLPAHGNLAMLGSITRNMESLAKLGGVVISSLPDLAVNASMLRHNGVPLFEAYAKQIVGLLPQGEGAREVADTLGVGIDGLIGHVMNRFKSEDGGMGKLSRTVELFHRANLLGFWTDSMKSATGLMLSNNLGRNAERAFAELPARLQVTLRRYGIEAAEWDQMRPHAAQAADGNVHLLPDSIPDAALQTKLQTYIMDQVREGMTEPTAGNITFGRWGTTAGTPAGELVRLFMQFKTYPFTFISRTLGREFGRGVDWKGGTFLSHPIANTGRAIANDLPGVAHLIIATTALGYVSMTLKDLAKGRNPRDPQDTAGYAKTVMAAMVQGGGLGLYGDFLFGEANRMGGGPVTSFFGPTAGTLDDAAKLFQAVRDGVFKGDMGHTASQGLQLAKNNAPLINLFYTRAALDYFVLYGLQEAANPGFLRRYEQRVKKENNQTFWLRPTDAVR